MNGTATLGSSYIPTPPPEPASRVSSDPPRVLTQVNYVSSSSGSPNRGLGGRFPTAAEQYEMIDQIGKGNVSSLLFSRIFLLLFLVPLYFILSR